MSWANYYQAQLPGPVSARDALATARQIVERCAVPPIDLEVRWTVPDARALADLAARLRTIPATAERVVKFALLPDDAAPIVDLLRHSPHPVELSISGAEPDPALSLSLELERTAGDFTVALDVNLRDARPFVDLRAAVIARLRDACHLLPCDPAAIVDLLLAEAARGTERLVRGLAADGYRLTCRSWRGTDPRSFTLAPARFPDPPDLARLWSDPLLALGGRLIGPDCLATAARIAELTERPDYPLAAFHELDVDVHSEADLDVLVPLIGDSPLVAAWWCGFDDRGRAYHGVRLALNGRYQDGQAGPEPGHHELMVLVDAKRRAPLAHDFAAALAARAGISLVYARTGL